MKQDDGGSVVTLGMKKYKGVKRSIDESNIFHNLMGHAQTINLLEDNFKTWAEIEIREQVQWETWKKVGVHNFFLNAHTLKVLIRVLKLGTM